MPSHRVLFSAGLAAAPMPDFARNGASWPAGTFGFAASGFRLRDRPFADLSALGFSIPAAVHLATRVDNTYVLHRLSIRCGARRVWCGSSRRDVRTYEHSISSIASRKALGLSSASLANEICRCLDVQRRHPVLAVASVGIQPCALDIVCIVCRRLDDVHGPIVFIRLQDQLARIGVDGFIVIGFDIRQIGGFGDGRGSGTLSGAPTALPGGRRTRRSAAYFTMLVLCAVPQLGQEMSVRLRS